MNRLLQLKQDKSGKLDAAAAILAKARDEKRNVLTPEERTSFDTTMADADAIDVTLKMEERIAGAQAALTTTGTGSPNSGDPRNQPKERILDKPYTSFGEQLLEIRQAAQNPHNVPSRLLELNTRAAAGSSEAVPADGGFLVYPDFSSEILKIAHDQGEVYTRARAIPLSETTNAIKIPGIDETSRVDGSRWGGVRMYWQNEAEAFTGSKPKFRLVELQTKKLTGLYYATDELLTDARALGSIVMQAFGEEMAFKLDDALIRGNGAGIPLGILNAPALITVNKETGQAAATIVYENIKKMWGRMWARSRKNAVWFINQDVEQQLYGMSQAVGVAGSPVFLPPGGASDEPYSRLFARPVIPIEQCDTVGTIGDVILADFSQYVTVDKGNMQSAASMHVRFLTDEMTYRWIYRVDGQPSWHSALTPFKGSNTLSPFVVLQSR